MASNKHHELAKRVMEQVSDLLVDYPIRQANSFVNTAGIFPRIIKFDYLGKYNLKGPTRLIIEAGIEMAADYQYFNTNYTWIKTKRIYYSTNFGRYRSNLVPGTDESFFAKTYELTIGNNGLVDVDLIRNELTYYFLPYLDRLVDVNALLGYLHGHKPNREEVSHAYQHHAYFYNWLAVIYLLLTAGRYGEAEFCLAKIIDSSYSLDRLSINSTISEAIFFTINKLQKDFLLSRVYAYDRQQRRIVSS